jgi:hypothetical protein
MIGSDRFQGWVNLGVQVNLAFRLWSNLDTALSCGLPC